MTMLASTLQPWYAASIPHFEPSQQTSLCVHEAVTAAIRRQPQRALLVDETRHLTNAMLLDAIDRRARALLSRCEGGDIVAVMLDNGVELAVTYFACLRAGLRYLPLPMSPGNVTAGLLDATVPRLVVTSALRDPCVAGIETLRVDSAENPPADFPLPLPDPSRSAHVLLTSGTESGIPRAVVTEHAGSMLSHSWRTQLWPFDRSRDVVGCNIFGIWDVVPALMQGVPVVMLADVTLRDPLALAGAVVRYDITRLMITPTLLDACLESSDAVAALRRLRLIVLCGETVTAPLMQRAWERLPGVQFANLYSLSECHDVAAGNLAPGQSIDTGRIAPFADVHVVRPDDRCALVPVGQAGRVLVGGRGLALGYLDEQATAERFFEIAPGVDAVPRRVYDTGDLGRLDADGTLEILGRANAEVKVRGAWADPDAVAAMLLQQPGVSRAATVAHADGAGHVSLRAFVVPSGDAPSGLARVLRAELAARLPPQSVPARIEVLEELPLLASGKIDVMKLRGARRWYDAAAPHVSGSAGSLEHAGSLESAVLTAFRDVLEQPGAAATDTFDDLGGDSLAAIALCGKIQASTGKLVRVRDLQRHSSAADLARYLGQRRSRVLQDRVSLPIDHLPPAAPPATWPPQTVLLTGATGTLGSALLRRLIETTRLHVVVLVRAHDDRHARTRLMSVLPDYTAPTRVTAVAGDLGLPRLGLSPKAFHGIARQVDLVLHLGARVDMFAGYEALAAANVAGTRVMLELALAAGAVFHHLSSSAVLPLDCGETWDETRHGRSLLDRLAPRLARSDGYSQSKLCAEALVWQAAERGLQVTAVRVPHLIDGRQHNRLTDTLEALLELGVLPEGRWQWQLADVDSVCERLVRLAQTEHRNPPLVHIAPPPVTDMQITAALASHGHRPRRLSLPALANVIAEAARHDTGRSTDRRAASVSALDQLAREHGIRAALCLGEPLLTSSRPVETDSARLLVDLLPD